MPARGQTRKGANKLIDQIVLKGPSQRPSLNRNEMLPATSGVPSGWDPLDRAIEVKLGEFATVNPDPVWKSSLWNYGNMHQGKPLSS